MSDSTERNCNKCIHHTSGNCDSWDCKMQTVEDAKKEAVNEYVKMVVEELEKESKRWEDSGKRYEDECEIAVGRGLRKAIKIVNQYVVSDDVCEYKIKDKVIYASCNNKQIASAFCWFNECGDYKYCPYCGKKIKVVE